MWRPFKLGVLAVALLLIPGFALAGDETERYGDGIDLQEATPIADILADPDSFIGKTVRIDGGVLEVCPAKGCWMDLGSAETKMRVKVDDDVIIFPCAAEGKMAAAQGVVEAIELDRDQYVAWLDHLAEERGETFDPETAELGDGPFRLIQIRGTGAQIHGTNVADH